MKKKAQKPIILIVDDEKYLRDIIKQDLSELDAQFQEAEDGGEALRVLDAHPIAVIISDIMMPKMTGLELLAKIRENGLATPFIVVTAFGSKEHTLQALRLGAFGFVEKPLDPDSLITLTHEALQTAAATAKIRSKMHAALREVGFDKSMDEKRSVAEALMTKSLRFKKTA